MTDTSEQLRRLVSSYKTLTDAQANQLNVLKDRLYTLRGADKALDSEREANALLTEQLAASQSREQKLRAAINSMAGETTSHYDRLEIARKALSLPQDTSALDQIKAGYEAQIQQLRDALAAMVSYAREEGKGLRIADEALALPQDTSALESLIEKAGEVMRARCVAACGELETPSRKQTDVARSWITGTLDSAEAVKAQPNIKLEDLK